MKSKSIKYIDSIFEKVSIIIQIVIFVRQDGTNNHQMKVTREAFGLLPDNREASCYTAINSGGLILKVSDYGGIIQSIQVPDKNGELADVVLGFDSLKDYLQDHPYIGTLVGRYANRIARGTFTLDGTEYQLARNHGSNHLHGGLVFQPRYGRRVSG